MFDEQVVMGEKSKILARDDNSATQSKDVEWLFTNQPDDTSGEPLTNTVDIGSGERLGPVVEQVEADVQPDRYRFGVAE